MSGVEVTAAVVGDGWDCKVTVRNGGVTHNRVRVSRADLARLAPGASDPVDLVEASFAFLLEREPKSRSFGSLTSPSSGGTSPTTSGRSGTAWHASVSSGLRNRRSFSSVASR
jgi:hypothetical protein